MTNDVNERGPETEQASGVMKIVMYEMWRTRECDLQKQHAVEQQAAGAG